MKASILTIGDELLIGQVVDTNATWIAAFLQTSHVHVIEKRTIADDRDAILFHLKSLSDTSEIIFVTGGLGPTNDDITKKTIAEFANLPMEFDQGTYDQLVKFFERIDRPMMEAHKAQCFMPKGVKLFENKMGTAPGMLFKHKGVYIVSMPGVPHEMKYIMNHGVLAFLKEKQGNETIYHRTIRTVGEGESRLADKIDDLISPMPEGLKIAYLPSLAKVRIRISGKGQALEVLQKKVDSLVDKISERLNKYVFGYDETTLTQAVGNMFLERNLKLGIAESCTGGLIAHTIVSTPGSSRYFSGGVVSYSNELKTSLLNVAIDTLESAGAVSEETVIQMVKGGLSLLDADIMISASGIAGPTGGTPDKPVGTIWIAVGNEHRVKTLKLSLGKNRLKNIEYTVIAALNLSRIFLLEAE